MGVGGGSPPSAEASGPSATPETIPVDRIAANFDEEGKWDAITQRTDGGRYAAIRSRKAFRVSRFVSLAIVGVFLSLGLAQASPVGATAFRDHRVLARKYVRPADGAYVRTRSGESIFVPPGVMAKPGFVTISSVGHGVFNIHIHAPWHGTVAVSLPLSHRGDSIIHDIGDLWLTEGTSPGQRTVWVTQLSLFSNVLNKIKSIPSKLCIVFSVSQALTCVAQKLPKFINGELAKWIVAKLPGGCVAP